jgi:hypothetical protein
LVLGLGMILYLTGCDRPAIVVYMHKQWACNRQQPLVFAAARKCTLALTTI